MTSPALTPAPEGYPTAGPTVIPTDLSTTLDAALPRLSEGEAVRIRGLWPAEMEELLAVYEARVAHVSQAAVAIIAILHGAVRRGEWVEQREIARRAHAGLGTVNRVLSVLRSAGVLASEGGEFVPSRGKSTCQRHRLTSSPALVAVTSADRRLRMRAYAWLVGDGRMAPDDARALLREANALTVVRARLRRAKSSVELNSRTEHAASRYSEPATETVVSPSTGTSTWDTLAEAEGFALCSAPVSHPDDDPGECVERMATSSACGPEPTTSATAAAGPSRRPAWVPPESLVLAIAADARAVGERDPLRTAAALYREARDAMRSVDPLRLMSEAYARCAAVGRSDAAERRHGAGSTPIADLPAWVFAMARRELRGGPEPPWPGQPRRAAGPPPVPRCPEAAFAPAEGPAELVPDLGRSAVAIAEVGDAYEALDLELQGRAERRAAEAYPALAAGFRESVMWRRLVLDAAAEIDKRRHDAGEADGSRRR